MKAINLQVVFRDAIDLYKKYLWETLAVSGVLGVVTFLIARIFSDNLHMPIVEMSINVIVYALIPAVLIWYIEKREGGKSVTFSHAASHVLSQALPLIGVTILTYLIVLVGFVLLVIPGIIVLILLSQAYYLVFLENKNPIAALRISKDMTKGNRIRIGLVGLLWFVVYIILYSIHGVGFSFISPRIFSIIETVFPASFFFILSYSLWKEIQKNS